MDDILSMSHRRVFTSLRDAEVFMATEIDRPISAGTSRIGEGIELRSWTHELGGGKFSNVYDITWQPSACTADLHITASPAEARAMPHFGSAAVVATGGFFLLADKASGAPRQASLNLAISSGRILSLPVADHDALLSQGGRLSAARVRADGQLKLNGAILTWAGSRTERSAQCYVYGNGNAVIRNQEDQLTGMARVLDEESRLTPAMPADGAMVDVGCLAAGNGTFRSVVLSSSGKVDTFHHDLVVRCPASYVAADNANQIEIVRIGSLYGNRLPDSAVAVGPSFDCPDFMAHPVNSDPSLGSVPPFANRRIARLAFYIDPDQHAHVRLFDARFNSKSFCGVTPAEARSAIASDTGYLAGCFLDCGQSAKVWVKTENTTSYGNRHYLRWPTPPGQHFTWVPDEGRPAASFITITQ